MSLTSNKEHSDHLSKLQEQNGEDAREEVEDNRKKKTQADQRKYIKETKKKRKDEETYPLSRFTSAWLFIIKPRV